MIALLTIIQDPLPLKTMCFIQHLLPDKNKHEYQIKINRAKTITHDKKINRLIQEKTKQKQQNKQIKGVSF
jgi:hypothetical protein